MFHSISVIMTDFYHETLKKYKFHDLAKFVVTKIVFIKEYYEYYNRIQYTRHSTSMIFQIRTIPS